MSPRDDVTTAPVAPTETPAAGGSADGTATAVPEPEKKGFALPSAYTILFGLIVLAAIATSIVPAGAYNLNAGGEPMPGTYHEVARKPARILVDSLTAPINGLFGSRSSSASPAGSR